MHGCPRRSSDADPARLLCLAGGGSLRARSALREAKSGAASASLLLILKARAEAARELLHKARAPSIPDNAVHPGEGRSPGMRRRILGCWSRPRARSSSARKPARGWCSSNVRRRNHVETIHESRGAEVSGQARPGPSDIEHGATPAVQPSHCWHTQGWKAWPSKPRGTRPRRPPPGRGGGGPSTCQRCHPRGGPRAR